MEEVRFLTQGESGVVVEFGSVIDPQVNSRVHALANCIKGKLLPGIRAVVPTYRSVLILFDPLVVKRSQLIRATKELLQGLSTESLAKGRETLTVIIPTCYGGELGPDIHFVAEHNKLGEEEVIRIHTSTAYRIYMMGFTPGFPYLGGMSPQIAAPRLETPRTVIPAGSVGIAGNQTGLYPVESPGGWRLIGRTPLRVFALDKPNPFLYQAGDCLQFQSITPEEYEVIRTQVEQGTYEVQTMPGAEGKPS